MWSSFRAIFRKELIHILRDRATLIMAFSIPIFQLTLFGFIDQTVKHVATVVVDQDRSSESRLLLDRMRASGTFLIQEVTSDPRAARADITAGRARVGIVIPPNFHDHSTRGDEASVLILIDGSDSTVSAQTLASINGLFAQMNIEKLAKDLPQLRQAFAAHPIILFNPDGRTANFIIPGLVAILLQIVSMILSAVTIVRERERGTLEQLLVTPIHPMGLMLGKLGPYLLLGLGDTALILGLMRYAFGVPIRGSLFFLFCMAIVYLFALLSLGLFISTRTSTQSSAQQLAQLFLLPSIFLSGYIFPVEGLPWVLRWIGKVLPATHMIAIMRGIVLREAGPAALLPHVLALIAISTVLVTMSLRRFRKVAS